MAGERFFTDEESTAEILSHMADDERHRYLKYGHQQIEAAFVDRVFIIYKPEGLTPAGKHRPPTVAATVKVVDFEVNKHTGAQAVVENPATRERQTITYMPRKLFGYLVYMAMPTKLMLRWDARLVQGAVWRTMSFALLIKTKNKASFYSKGNTYCVTPNDMKRLYPEVVGEGQFTF